MWYSLAIFFIYRLVSLLKLIDIFVVAYRVASCGFARNATVSKFEISKGAKPAAGAAFRNFKFFLTGERDRRVRGRRLSVPAKHTFESKLERRNDGQAGTPKSPGGWHSLVCGVLIVQGRIELKIK